LNKIHPIATLMSFWNAVYLVEDAQGHGTILLTGTNRGATRRAQRLADVQGCACTLYRLDNTSSRALSGRVINPCGC
jgi:hypothetical protein